MREDVTHWEPLPHETVGDDVIRDTLDQLEVDDIQVDSSSKSLLYVTFRHKRSFK